MQYRYCTFVNQLIDIAPDFIVRGAAENVLFDLLPLLDRTVMAKTWDRNFLHKLLAIPTLRFGCQIEKRSFPPFFHRNR